MTCLLSNSATRERPADPPGPRGHPLLGMLPSLRRDPLQVFAAAAAEYGDLVRLRAGTRILYLLNHPDHVRHVLQDNHRNYRRTRLNEKLKLVLGEGLATSEGERWSRQRRLIQPAFQPQKLNAFGPVIAAATGATVARWRRAIAGAGPSDGAAMDVAEEMRRLTLEVATRSMFGTDASADAEAIGRALSVAQDYAMRRLFALTDVAERLPTARNRRFWKARRVLDGIVHRIINERRSEKGRAGRDDLLSLLLDARDPETGAAMDARQLRDEIMTMLLAGHETAANALAWTWHLLAQNPAAEDRLLRETQAVLGGRDPGPEDLGRMPYARMVIQEALRLYPPAWRMGRQAIAEDRIGGYRIPAGGIVILCQYLTHRHPGFWDRPDRFDPDRFSPDRSAARPRHAYFPFAGGPHTCIGAQFAMMEMQLVLPMIARRFRLRPLPGHPVEAQPLITLRPKHGLMMIAEERGGVPTAAAAFEGLQW